MGGNWWETGGYCATGSSHHCDLEQQLEFFTRFSNCETILFVHWSPCIQQTKEAWWWSWGIGDPTMTSLLLALHAQAHYQVHQYAGFHVSPWVPCTISCTPSLDLDTSGYEGTKSMQGILVSGAGCRWCLKRSETGSPRMIIQGSKDGRLRFWKPHFMITGCKKLLIKWRRASRARA